jgi:putative methyltransferase
MNFYKSAALALDHLDKHQGSVKGSLAAAGIKTANPGESKRILACERCAMSDIYK